MTTSSASPSRPSFPTVATKALSTAQSSQLNVAAETKVAPSAARPPSQSNVSTDNKVTAASGPRAPSQVNGEPDNKATSKSRPSSRAPTNTRSRQDVAAPDPTSQRATLALIRKTLVADGSHGADLKGTPASIEGVLPPLTSSNEVDVQLYAIVAIVIKDFVNSWYTKITPDHTFVDEVIQIIAHCTRALEQRLRQIDITELMLDELPVLVERHIVATRTAATAQASLQYGENPLRIYHALNPHPALDPTLPPEQQRSYESAYRQLLIQGALAVLLPTEDLANACLRTLVGDIIADLILGQAVADKISQPWLIHGIVSKVVGMVAWRPTATSSLNAGQTHHPDRRISRLEQFGLLSSNTAEQEHNSPARRQSSLSAWFWKLLQSVFIAYEFLRFLLIGMAHAHHLRPRLRLHKSHQVSASTPSPYSNKSLTASSRRVVDADRPAPRAVLSYRIFGCVSTILDLSLRMPWLESSMSFCQYFLIAGSGRLGALNSTLDK
ncbi:hypothetical protein A1O1_01041 [Capronia coronata CBS 617.96]|uniref:PXA domain-containing protein n=1 Tax=Capronia coronata CBS 617.96 TaxID=1182541 RepID=W9Z2X4_9EURO|nr:uncharacterized protein A1O1_01041 [Capronia coronata CBS 617.96]EXJ95916.1 hypothetical protein A1O1_01041 [Capronia coronata CBS 617.96]